MNLAALRAYCGDRPIFISEFGADAVADGYVKADGVVNL